MSPVDQNEAICFIPLQLLLFIEEHHVWLVRVAVRFNIDVPREKRETLIVIFFIECSTTRRLYFLSTPTRLSIRPRSTIHIPPKNTVHQQLGLRPHILLPTANLLGRVCGLALLFPLITIGHSYKNKKLYKIVYQFT